MKDAETIAALSALVGHQNIISNAEDQFGYTQDCSSGKFYKSLCIVKPGNAEEIAEILKFCNLHQTRVVVRSGGTGVSGGSIPEEQSIVLSMERLNRILEINRVDRFVILEAGVNTLELEKRVLEAGLKFPQNISSAYGSMIGGNIAVSSGSPKSVKYGPTKNYVLNLEVVLPNGEILWTGKNVRKNASGYNLTQLFTGSEGTLGIITKAVIQLVTLQHETLILVPFLSSEKLFSFVKKLFISGFNPSGLEFMDKNGFKLAAGSMDKRYAISEDTQGLLWIEFEADQEAHGSAMLLNYAEMLGEYTDEEIFVAQTPAEIARLWEFRKNIGSVAVSTGEFKDFDLVVLRSHIDLMYQHIDAVCTQLGLQYLVIAHIGDGNFHINVFRDKHMDAQKWKAIIHECIDLLFTEAVRLGGEISGEHGIGTYNREVYSRFNEKTKIKLMKDIKQLLDPNDILNSGNIF
ncbi:FAD-binding oxidoreductase [Pedobacter sp. UYP1]|uniref:FAD-binding oxidoreductase n=1 Tax=Pedobacter sp. UYP1 TaxID=1756396 RepID=UPI00339A486A